MRLKDLVRQSALGVATLAIWLADFAIMMSRSLIRAFPHPVDGAIRRACICVCGLLLCQLIYWILRRYAPRAIERRMLFSLLLSVAGALGYAAISIVAYFVILPRWGDPRYGALSHVILVVGLHFWVYLACVTVYWIVHYSDELGDKERRLAEAHSLMLDAQNRMLRYQINPHFLFNTLNALSTLILQRENRRAEQMVLALSAFLRRSLEKDPVAKVTLAEELEAAQEYLTLEGLRFGDRLNVRICVLPSVHSALTPSLILQPLLENAVKYAVSASSATVTIDLTAEVRRDRLIICLTDDGPGAGVGQPTLGLGLENVRKRLEAIYGKAGRVDWGKVSPQGFQVSLDLPLERHDQAARTVIVDDEPLALRRLEIALSEIPGIEVAGRAHDGEEALAVIAALRPDLVFLDIKMPKQSGLDLAGALAAAGAPAVIFVTAYGRYAIEAFDLAAVDYLLKPFEFERLRRSVERARAVLDAKDAAVRLTELNTVIAALREESDPIQPRYESELWINERGVRVRLPVETIEWFAAERDYVRINTGERNYLVRTSIRSLTERLDPANFTRVHRSFLVQSKGITRIVRRSAGAMALVLASGREIPIGRRYQAALRERFRWSPPA